MKNKRLISSIFNGSQGLSQQFFELESYVESSRGFEHFDPGLYLFKNADKVYCGISVIGIDAQHLPAGFELFDLSLGSEMQQSESFFALEGLLLKLEPGQMLRMDEKFENMTSCDFQKLID